MSATVEITEKDGRYTAVDSETGASGVGKTRAMALAALAIRLGAQEAHGGGGRESELRALADRTRKRFEEKGVTDADVEDAIEWARSE
ncbi:MAG: hypothetical protein ABEJ89_02930 [Haloarculaceae archaeon]